MKALVTGAAGFVGGHLVGHLLDQGYQVVGVDRPGVEPRLARQSPSLDWRAINLEARDAVSALLADARPDQIYHLAGQPSVHLSWTETVATFRTNVEPLVHLIQASLALGFDPAILVIGSNEVYGVVPPDQQPVTEDAPLRPLSPYAVSKVAQDFVAAQYVQSHNVRAIRVRPFTHIGPGQGPDFVASNFARQVALIESGAQPPVIKVGNLEAQRDFTDVRDMVRAYRLAVELAEPGAVYNLGSGQPIRIRSILDSLLALASVPITVEVDPDRLRPADVPIAYCDPRRFQAKTGWQTTIPIERTLADILTYWREATRDRT